MPNTAAYEMDKFTDIFRVNFLEEKRLNFFCKHNELVVYSWSQQRLHADIDIKFDDDDDCQFVERFKHP